MALPRIGLEAILLTRKFLQAARQYQSELDKLEKKTKKASKGMDEGAKEAKRFDLELAAIGVTAGLVAAGIVKVIDAVGDMARAAAPIVDMRRAFVTLAAEAGISADQLLAELQRVSAGTVDTETLIRAANRALLAGGAQFAQELPKLLQIAQASARATGQDLQFVFDTLIKGIIKGSRLLIDNAEIYIKLGTAVEEYANKLGKTEDTLTETQRQEAVLFAVLEQGEEILAKSGDQAGAAVAPFQQLNVSWRQFTQGIGEIFLPLAQKASQALVNLLDGVKKFIAGIVGLVGALTALPLGLNPFKEFAIVAKDVLARLEGTIPAGEQAAVAIKDVGDAAEDTAKDLSELNKKLAELETQYEQRLEDLKRSWERQWDDILLGRERQIEDADRALVRRREDMARQGEQRIEDIERDRVRRLDDLRRARAERTEEYQREANRRREELEERHQERLYQIQTRYYDTIEEAARRNDAVAIVQAMRTRQRELRDAQRARDKEQQDLSRDLGEKRRELAEEAKREKAEAQRQYEEALEDLKIAQQRQEEELQLSLDRQREDRLIAWQRQKEDFDRNTARQMADLDLWYARQKEKLIEELGLQTEIAVAAIGTAAAAIATATSQGIQQIAQTALQAEIGGATLRQFQRQQAATQPADISREIGGATLRNWMRAEGGLDVVSSPTPFVMGDRGPEAVLSVPLQGQMNVNHRFSPLNVGVDGIPGGMDTTAVQAMMWDVFTQMGRELLAGRGL